MAKSGAMGGTPKYMIASSEMGEVPEHMDNKVEHI